MMIILFLYLLFIIFLIAATWRVFEKAEQPGWAAMVPIYNAYIMLKIGGKPGWWLLLLIIPGVNIIFCIWMLNMISKSFGKDEGFTIGMVFLGFIFWPILAFGDSRYLGPYGNLEEFQARQQTDFDFEQHN